MKKLMLLLVISFLVFSCEETLGPNEIGGNYDLDITQPGSEIGVYIEMEGANSAAFSAIRDTVVVVSNDNGIVISSGRFYIDEENLAKIDTMMGTSELPEQMKRDVVDHYLERFGATIDTSDKENMMLDVEIKTKMTSDGIQDFVHSDDKPFTIIKYSAKVGDKYKFTRSDGTEITREVVYKSSDDEYEMGFKLIKVFRIEEAQEDPLIDKIVYIANHKFGLVGLEVHMADGHLIKSTMIPWAGVN